MIAVQSRGLAVLDTPESAAIAVRIIRREFARADAIIRHALSRSTGRSRRRCRAGHLRRCTAASTNRKNSRVQIFSNTRTISLRESRTGIRHALPMCHVVCPRRGPAEIREMTGIEIITMNKRVVHDHGARGPARIPAPGIPALPSCAVVEPKRNGRTVIKDMRMRRIIPARVGIIEGRSPDPEWIVVGHIDHIRLCRENLVNGTSGLIGLRHHFLR